MKLLIFTRTTILLLYSLSILLLLPGCFTPDSAPTTPEHKKKRTFKLFKTKQEYALSQKERDERDQLRKQFKKITACSLPSMTSSQLNEAKTLAIALGYEDEAIIYLEQMIKISHDQEQRKIFRLELADMQFDKGNFDKATRLYGEYIVSYPGSEHKEYAEYKAILCRFYLSLSPDRDQTKTEETLEHIQAYLNEPLMSRHYLKAIKDIERQCLFKLRDREKKVFDFYLKQHNYTSAQRRLEYIKETFSRSLNDTPQLVLQMEIEVAKKQGDIQKIALKQQELENFIPDIPLTIAADESDTPSATTHA